MQLVAVVRGMRETLAEVSPWTWEQCLAALSILLAFGATGYLVYVKPDPNSAQANDGNLSDDVLKKSPVFYLNYERNTSNTATIATTESPTTRRVTGTATSNESTVANVTTRTIETTTRTESRVVSYQCKPIMPYLREKYYDYRCRYNNGTSLNPDTISELPEDNKTNVTIQWESEDDDLFRNETTIAINSGDGVVFRKSVVIWIPPLLSETLTDEGESQYNSSKIVSNYTLTANVTEGDVWLSKPDPIPKANLAVSVYPQNISKIIEQDREAEQQERRENREELIQQETRLFRWLGVVVLWVGAIQLALAALNHRQSKGK